MKPIKLFEQFILEDSKKPKLSAKDIFIPRRLKERWDDLVLPYLNKGYTKEQIFVAKPLDEELEITKNNVKEFKDIKVIIGDVIINGDILKELNLDEVSGDFNCSFNRLTSLKGGPKLLVTKDYFCSNNTLTSLEGAPIIVNAGFYCSHNKLTNLKGAPKVVNDDFAINDNTKNFTEEEVKGVVDVKGKVYV